MHYMAVLFGYMGLTIAIAAIETALGPRGWRGPLRCKNIVDYIISMFQGIV